MSTTTVPGPLPLAAAATTVAGLVVVGIAAVLGGSAAVYGATAGTVIALLVFTLGAFAVDVVARVMPVASLLVALLTYTMQVLLMLVVFVGLNRSGVLEETMDREWLGGSIIAAVLTWTFAHLTASARARIPAYDVTGGGPVGGRSEPLPSVTEGGAR